MSQIVIGQNSIELTIGKNTSAAFIQNGQELIRYFAQPYNRELAALLAGPRPEGVVFTHRPQGKVELT